MMAREIFVTEQATLPIGTPPELRGGGGDILWGCRRGSMTASRRRRRGERYTFYAIRPSSSTEFLGRSLLCTEERPVRRPEYSKIGLCKANKPSYTHCTEYTIRVHYHVEPPTLMCSLVTGVHPSCLCVYVCVSCRTPPKAHLFVGRSAGDAAGPCARVTHSCMCGHTWRSRMRASNAERPSRRSRSAVASLIA